jgi:hypothetical protein
MNREVHVRFWESAGLRCPAPLAFIKAYGSAREARLGIGGWLAFYNDDRPHQALDYRTPRAVFEDTACNHVDNAPAALSRYPHGYRHHSNRKVLTNVEW